VGDGGTYPPDTMTCPKKSATRYQGIEPAGRPLRLPILIYNIKNNRLTIIFQIFQ